MSRLVSDFRRNLSFIYNCNEGVVGRFGVAGERLSPSRLVRVLGRHDAARDGAQVLVLAYLKLLEVEVEPLALLAVALVLQDRGADVADLLDGDRGICRGEEAGVAAGPVLVGQGAVVDHDDGGVQALAYPVEVVHRLRHALGGVLVAAGRAAGQGIDHDDFPLVPPS